MEPIVEFNCCPTDATSTADERLSQNGGLADERAARGVTDKPFPVRIPTACARSAWSTPKTGFSPQ